jgi:hypothetical protein
MYRFSRLFSISRIETLQTIKKKRFGKRWLVLVRQYMGLSDRHLSDQAKCLESPVTSLPVESTTLPILYVFIVGREI